MYLFQSYCIVLLKHKFDSDYGKEGKNSRKITE